MKLSNLIYKYHVERLDNLLASNGFKRVKIQEDGDCFFNALRYQLNEEISLDSLRNQVCDHLEQNKQHYLEFIEFKEGDDQLAVFTQQVEIFRLSGQWKQGLGDCLPLSVANLLQRPIKIFTSKISCPVIDISPNIGDTGGDYMYLASQVAQNIFKTF